MSDKCVCPQRVSGTGGHAGKSNKGVRDRRKLREKRRSTGVMHLPSTETGGSSGEDENNENSVPPAALASNSKPPSSVIGVEVEEKVTISPAPPAVVKQRSESDLDADDEANNSGDVRGNRDEAGQLKIENDRLLRLVEAKDKKISALEMQVAQLARQMSDFREENAKLLRVLRQSQNSTISP